MTRYGISNIDSLAEATRISRRAGIGYVMATVACNLGLAAGQNLAAAQAFSLVFAYVFFGVAMATAGRRRMLLTTPSTGIFARLITLSLLGAGIFVLLASSVTLAALLAMVVATMAG